MVSDMTELTKVIVSGLAKAVVPAINHLVENGANTVIQPIEYASNSEQRFFKGRNTHILLKLYGGRPHFGNYHETTMPAAGFYWQISLTRGGRYITNPDGGITCEAEGYVYGPLCFKGLSHNGFKKKGIIPFKRAWACTSAECSYTVKYQSISAISDAFAHELHQLLRRIYEPH